MVLHYPDANEVSKLLSLLLDRPAPIKERAGKKPPAVEPGQWVCPIKDDADNVVGAVVLDLAGVCALGGALMMLPEAVLKEHLRGGQVSEGLVDGSTEVVNNLVGLINKNAKNPHVRAGVLVSAKDASVAGAPWLKAPQAWTTMTGESAIGPWKMSLLST